ncbi:hypothetical protein [Mycolicibacterium fluoranthenivorans]|uniref:Tail assembly chaperone n=1 Tax=Mycolicibacterium fluoranthenivorans TaxID=258505 RepID=A0A7X5U5P3_9MYCO|nr:hypothetical protein [Mycolicibacterium fluoranthenivorans]MCV7354497.1 hypothetical protein [Mycolicibacterium fluoranthenivorans]NIH98898.1 hypothetical protein [Mycolicibacterium fluoranthenivorans]
MATRAVNPVPVPSERLQKLLLDTNRPDPYPVTDTLVIVPPTKKRRDELRESHREIEIAQQLLARALLTAPSPRPEFPAIPGALPDKATAKQQASYKVEVTQFEKLAAGWEQLSAAWEGGVAKFEAAVAAHRAKISEQADRYTRALFGAAYDEVLAFFDDQDPELWDAFQVDLQEHFRIIPKAPEVPDDGTCPHCGHVEDTEQAGKAPESSD